MSLIPTGADGARDFSRGILRAKTLKRYRRYAYGGCFVIAAVLTPPDVLTQTGLAVPLILLYELSILCVRLVQPKLDEE